MSALTCHEVRDLAAAYVLGALEPSLSAAVREHLATHSDAHPEFEELGSVAPALAYLADPASPPAALRARLMAAATSTPQEAAAEPLKARAAAPSPRPWPAESRPSWRAALTARRAAVAGWSFAAAAVIAIVALVVVNSALQADVSSARQFGDQLHRAEALAASPGSRVAVIASGSTGGPANSGVPTGPNGLAVIPPSGSAVLVMQGLEATSAGQVYEAWVIVGKQAPVPVGSFAVGGDGLGWLGDFTAPSGGDIVVALTREPGPGATKPTLPIVALGAATVR